jgi:hypothetical protein
VPLLETVPYSKIMIIIQLNDGIVGHAAARRLDKSDYHFEDVAPDQPSPGYER